MLFETLFNQLADRNNEIQIKIEELQAVQRQILQEMQDVGSAESKALAALQLMREAIAGVKQVCPSQMDLFRDAAIGLFDDQDSEIVGLLPEVTIEVEPEIIITPPPSDDTTVEPVAENTTDLSEIADTPEEETEAIEPDTENKDDKEDLTKAAMMTMSIQSVRKLAAYKGVGGQGTRKAIVDRIMAAGGISRKAASLALSNAIFKEAAKS